MKILQQTAMSTIFLFACLNAGFFSSEKDVNVEVQQELKKIKGDNNILNQMKRTRSLLMSNRKQSFDSTTQEAFGNSLQELFNKRDKADLRQNKLLRSLLSSSLRTPLLSSDKLEYVKNLLDEVKKSECFTPKGRMVSVLKDLNQCKSFHVKNRMLMNFVRHQGVKEPENEVKVLFAKTLKDTYAVRPLNDEVKLGYLKQLIEDACDSTLLSENDKKYFQSTILPDVEKNIKTAKLSPQGKVFGQVKDITSAYFKATEKDFDIKKNNSLPGPVLIS